VNPNKVNVIRINTKQILNFCEIKKTQHREREKRREKIRYGIGIKK